MGQMSYERYEEIIKKGILKTPLVKLEMLRQEDESVYDEIIKTPLKGSTLNITNQSGCRRSLTMNLNNNDGSFLPTPNGNLWINTKFKFSIGIQDTNGDTIFFPQGVFCLAHSEPEVTSELSNKIVTINASDKWSLSETVTGSIFQIGINQSITDNIRKILNLIKDSKNPILKTILADITQYDLRWDNNSTYGQILKDLGNMFQRDCYYNEMGVLVYEDMPSTESLEVIWNFNKLDRVYMSGKRVFRFDQMYNQVYVRSDTTSGYTYSGLAQNTDLTSSSNIYLNSINTLDISDSKLQSDTACLKEAQYLLEKNKRVQDSIEITCLPLPHATVNKAFTIEDNNLSTFKNYYAIQSVSLPLDLSQNMSILGFRYNDTTDFQDLTSESGNIHELPTGR